MSQEPQAAVVSSPRGCGPTSTVEAEEPLVTTRLSPLHRTSDFTCSKSERVTLFLRTQAARWVEQRLCGVFIFPDPEDPTHIWGYYTLSQYVITRDEMKRADQDNALVRSVPMALIGFMGKQDGAPPKLGAALIIDAARRAQRQLDIPAWGMAVEPERGRENRKLWGWYESVNFVPAKTLPKLMYASYASLIPK